MTFTVAETPWVTLRKGDPSFQLQGPYSLANRAGIIITPDCPNEHKWIIQQCFENGGLKQWLPYQKTILLICGKP